LLINQVFWKPVLSLVIVEDKLLVILLSIYFAMILKSQFTSEMGCQFFILHRDLSFFGININNPLLCDMVRWPLAWEGLIQAIKKA